MSQTRPTLTPDERAEWDALVRSAVGADLPCPDMAMTTTRIRERLDDAIQAHRPWAHRVIEEAAVNGIRCWAKAWLREHDTIAVRSRAGRVASMSTRVGVQRGGTHRQVVLAELTWDELQGHIDMLVAQRAGTTDRIAAERKLLALRDAHPTTATIGEALAAEATTLGRLLGQAA